MSDSDYKALAFKITIEKSTITATYCWVQLVMLHEYSTNNNYAIIYCRVLIAIHIILIKMGVTW